MRTYTLMTGIIFGLLVVADIVRAAVEVFYVFLDPFFIAFTVVAAVLCLWALRLVSQSKSATGDNK